MCTHVRARMPTHTSFKQPEVDLTKSLYQLPSLLPLTKPNPSEDKHPLIWCGNLTHQNDLCRQSDQGLGDCGSLQWWPSNDPHLPLFMILGNHLLMNLDCPCDSLTTNRTRQNWPCRTLKSKLEKALPSLPSSLGTLTRGGNQLPYEKSD